jgi:hypothetical protein
MFYLLFGLVASKCISLQGSVECPEFGPYAILATTEYSDLKSFDEYLARIAFETAPSVERFKELMSCPRFEGQGRFMDSTLCAFTVSTSYQQCKAEIPAMPAPLTLCNSVCEDSRNALKSSLANGTRCDAAPNPEAQENRALLFAKGTNSTNLNDFCEALGTNPESRAPTCFKGLKKEVELCGFHKKEFLEEFCELNKADECCATALNSEKGEKGEKKEGGHEEESAPLIATISAGVAVIVVAGIAYKVVGYRQAQKHEEHHKPAYLTQKARQSFGFLSTEPVSTTKNETFGNVRQSFIKATRKLSIPDLAFTREPKHDVEQADIMHKLAPGVKVKCEEPYDPQMDDEMVCNIGDVVEIVEDYDDGWAYGDNLTTLEKGAFPKTICTLVSGGREYRKSSLRTRSVFSLHPRS